MDVIGMLPYTDKIDNPVIVTYNQEDKVFDDLSRGDGVVLDAMLNYLPVLLYEIGRGRPLKIVGVPLFLVPNAIAIEPGDPDLSTLIKKIVTAMRDDGTLTIISMKWFNFDLTADQP